MDDDSGQVPAESGSQKSIDDARRKAGHSMHKAMQDFKAWAEVEYERAKQEWRLVGGHPTEMHGHPHSLAFLGEIKKQTDRGSAVLAAAFLEWRVRGAVKSCLPCWGKEAESIFGSDNAPGELSYKYLCR